MLLRATDRYALVLLIIQRTDESAPNSKHRPISSIAAKKLVRNVQQIALTPRLRVLSCLEAEQVSETIVHWMRRAAKTNKYERVGVPFCARFESDDPSERNIDANKLRF